MLRYIYNIALVEMASYGQYNVKEVTREREISELQKDYPPMSPLKFITKQHQHLPMRISRRSDSPYAPSVPKRLFTKDDEKDIAEIENASNESETYGYNSDETYMPSEDDDKAGSDEKEKTAGNSDEEDDVFMVKSHKGNIRIRYDCIIRTQ